jgi:uncharacterized hydrophobic protein (TIGR00341 family)
MNLQLIEAYVPDQYFEKIDASLQEYSHISYWVSTESKDRILIRILVKTGKTEEILNYLEKISNVTTGFEVLLLPVQTYITRPSHDEEELKNKLEEKEEETKNLQRASRHELLGTIQNSSKINLTYTLLVILSAIVVTIGLVKNNETVIIGAMVIAPMLGPTISISFSSILGDYRLLWRSSITLFYAIIIIVVISILFSFLFPIPATSEQFWSRTHVNLSDIVLALASGTAGALSILNRLPGSLVGVMVAVALLPPTVVLGMTIGSSMWDEAYGSFLLLMVNINSILLSAIIVFSLSGIRPVKWEQIQRANTSRNLSIIFVSSIIILLVVAILFGERVDLI